MDILWLMLVYARSHTIPYPFNTLNRFRLYGMGLKIAFQLLICTKLQWMHWLPIYVVMFPLWALLTLASFKLVTNLIKGTDQFEGIIR